MLGRVTTRYVKLGYVISG